MTNSNIPEEKIMKISKAEVKHKKKKKKKKLIREEAVKKKKKA